MEVELPNFITNSFFQGIFDKKFPNQSLIVKTLWGEWATKKGDNYASDMYRIHVQYEDNQLIKTKPVLLKVNSKYLGLKKIREYVKQICNDHKTFS